MSFPSVIEKQLKEGFHLDIYSSQYIGGGDINNARLLETNKGKLFIKYNSKCIASNLFLTEEQGLKHLEKTVNSNASISLSIPSVIGRGQAAEFSFLILPYIASGEKAKLFWENFGSALATIHQTTTTQFGFQTDNFIGDLPQSNTQKNTWSEFYITQRLTPQVELASQNGYLDVSIFSLFPKIYQQIEKICPEEPPALIHGDLWNGNFMVDKNGQAVLIDPSIAYAHREMDLAMTYLFGGFSNRFYEAYQASYPLEANFKDRMEIYQLYYLMVHVNLFGNSYANSVQQILKRFT